MVIIQIQDIPLKILLKNVYVCGMISNIIKDFRFKVACVRYISIGSTIRTQKNTSHFQFI